jgi:thiol:disulfide interchange protein DsbD
MKEMLVACMLLWAPLAGAEGPDELLEPDQAFSFHAGAVGSAALQATWDIADGYYLYRDKFRFRSDTQGVNLGQPVMPPGKLKKDEFLGEVQTYRHQLAIGIPVTGAKPGSSISLGVTYQGCADQGVCYPPQSKQVSVTLPAASDGKGALVLALQDLGSKLGLGGQEREFLEPDQAFVLSTEPAGPDSLVAHWDIADGYYLYRNRLRFKLLEQPGIELGIPQLPAGDVKQDEFLGKTEVYHHSLTAKIPVLRASSGELPVKLDITYQGCAEAGLCYPPITKTVSLSLPAAIAGTAVASPPPASPAATPELAEQDRIAGSLASGSTPLVLASFFAFGLLLAFTPCIFPMIPILSSIIVGQGSRITMGRALALSVVYILAMALTYTGAGVVAGLFGENLQAAFQNPWLLGSFSALFVLLALSMFGFYELQLPSRWQSKLTEISNRQRGGTTLGVALMGFLSALIVGPCVAPPLAGALIYIGQSGDALLGGTALFAMSLGMGVPLLAVGASAGKLLPKAGPWMDTIKAVFGVVLLGVAIWMLERIVPPQISLILWGGLLIVCGVYLGALEPIRGASGWRKLWKGMGWIALLYGSVLLVGAASGGKDVFNPLGGLASSPGTGPASRHLSFRPVKSVADLQRELAAARERRQPVMLDFYADWCVECKRMEKYTFSDPAVQRALSGVTLLQADVTANDEEDKALLRHLGLIGPPATLFYAPDGKERRTDRLVGYLGPEQFVKRLHSAFG